MEYERERVRERVKRVAVVMLLMLYFNALFKLINCARMNVFSSDSTV